MTWFGVSLATMPASAAPSFISHSYAANCGANLAIRVDEMREDLLLPAGDDALQNQGQRVALAAEAVAGGAALGVDSPAFALSPASASAARIA